MHMSTEWNSEQPCIYGQFMLGTVVKTIQCGGTAFQKYFLKDECHMKNNIEVSKFRSRLTNDLNLS